ncbi:MAG: ATP-grasp domain-containing protein [Streptosporangiaceae bacterium]
MAGRWEIVFAYDSGQGDRPEVPGLLSRFGAAIDVAGLGYRGIIDRVRRHQVRGVVTFCEPMVRLANTLARDLGCRANPPPAVLRVTDKYLQRTALNRAGISVTPVAPVRHGSCERAARIVGVPAILKPRRGNASQGVTLVKSAAEVAAAMDGGVGGWLLEQPLAGASRAAEPWLGDYASVEMLSIDGCHRQLFVTDKLALGSGFRERGSVLPSSLPASAQHELVGLAAGALDAIGLRNGITHTEIKLTPAGPRIIEVNGRLGGPVHRLLTLAGSANPVALAIEVAVGGRPPASVPGFASHVATVHILPPAGATRIRALPDVAALRRLPGVRRVEEIASLGQPVCLAAGSLSRVMTIDLEAESRSELARRIEAVDAAAYAGAAFEWSGRFTGA